MDVGEKIQQRWAATMSGHEGPEVGVVQAHRTSDAFIGEVTVLDRVAKEELEERDLAPGATRSHASGSRGREEASDVMRTCFERDRDRIKHSNSFRRLAGKTQVFVFPKDHVRTRQTHALEVAQVAVGIAFPLRLNVMLTDAIALGHDCGHGPGGHASEEALSPYVDGGYDHAVWGADVALARWNLCSETLDGIRNHSWSRPAPKTPEGEVVSWADRIAYVCHDFEDAVSAGIVAPKDLPQIVRERCGATRSEQLNAFINAMILGSVQTQKICMTGEIAEALTAFRKFNYERVYMRPESKAQAHAVVQVLRALTEFYIKNPSVVEANDAAEASATSDEDRIARRVVSYVGGMTDRYAFAKAVELLDWDRDKLPIPVAVE